MERNVILTHSQIEFEQVYEIFDRIKSNTRLLFLMSLDDSDPNKNVKKELSGEILGNLDFLQDGLGIIDGTPIMQKCVICGKEFVGIGNNADPVAEGRCCNECNVTKVIPARIKLINDKRNIK